MFTEENAARADAIMAIYPDGHKRAAVRQWTVVIVTVVVATVTVSV